MRELFRPAMLICLVMLIPIIPFFFFAEAIKDWVESISENRILFAFVIFALLASDIFLPVPSSAVNTFAGLLGVFWGTLVCFLGLNAGCVFGFWVSRKWGSSLARWFSKESELHRMEHIVNDFCPATLAIVRGIPVLAEASVIVMGMHQLTWRKFLPPIMLANLVLAFAYSLFGNVAEQHNFFPIALAAAIAIPVLLLYFFKRWIERPRDDKKSNEAT